MLLIFEHIVVTMYSYGTKVMKLWVSQFYTSWPVWYTAYRADLVEPITVRLRLRKDLWGVSLTDFLKCRS